MYPGSKPSTRQRDDVGEAKPLDIRGVDVVDVVEVEVEVGKFYNDILTEFRNKNEG